MSDMTTTDIPAGTVNLSTTLTPGTYSTEAGQGQPSLSQPQESPAKAETLETALADEMKKMNASEAEKPAKADAKSEEKTDDAKAAKPDAKAEKPAPEVKTEAAKPSAEADKPDTTGQEGDKPPSEGKQVAPPARFLPKAREVWVNTPRPVQAEIERMEREYTAEIEQHKASRQFHEELSEYDGMAKKAGTSVKAALDRYVGFDRELSQDFGRGVAKIAQDQGKQPQAAIADVLRAYGVTPQQYAQSVLQNPQAHQASPQQAQRQAPQPDPIAQQALQEVASLKQQIAAQALDAQVIQPFIAANPRFEELQTDIAFFLNSGRVPDSLSPAERLAVAYDMAERINPSPYRPQAESADPDIGNGAIPDAGKKSVRGAPSDGMTPAAAETNEPLEDWLRKEMRKARS